MATDDVATQVFGSVLGGMEMLVIAIGDRLGYYRALDGAAMTPAQLAEATGTSPRYTREWLEQQAAAGLVQVTGDGDPEHARFELGDGAAEVLARPESLSFLAPLARQIAAAGALWTEIADGARSEEGLGWERYGADMREAQSDLNAPSLRRLLPDTWLGAALPELHHRMAEGEPVRVADVGAGGGWAAIGLAARFPNVTVDAFDVDAASVALARGNVEQAGLGSRVRVLDQDVAALEPSAEYDLVLAVECIHDMPYPVPVLSAMRKMALDGGAVLVVDEKAADQFTAPAGELDRVFYGFSLLICLPDGMSANPDGATGAVMRRPVLEGYAARAGFGAVEVLPVEHDMWSFYRLR